VSVTLKLATSLDGRIATARGESRWITGDKAREQVHRLRAMHQAVLIGVETAIADDPELTVRLPGYVGLQPSRVVLDSRGRLPLTSKLVMEAGRLDTVVVTTRPPKPPLEEAGVTVLQVTAKEGRVDPKAAVDALSADGPARMVRQLEQLNVKKPDVPVHVAARKMPDPASLTNVLIEGGGQVAASFLSAGLVDKIEWFRAPIVLGDEGRPAVGEFVLNRLADAPRFRRVDVQPLGEDLWERYERLS
jgi:diaminohydroxyphosphoribosylaminopyrimidine deaminase/5-amino-6-(5-phosphoribosylamino)uracil reductase